MKTMLSGTALAYGLIAIGALIRVVSYLGDFTFLPPNFAPIAGMALLGGAYVGGRQAWWVPVGALIISDLIIGFYHPLVMVAVYGSFLAIVWVGRFLRGRVSPGSVVAAAVGSSVLFYLVTNFAVWLTGLLYPLTLQGLLAAYTMGLPFFRYTLVGDLFFTGAFFVSYALAGRLAEGLSKEQYGKHA